MAVSEVKRLKLNGYISDLDRRSTPQVLYTYSYNHAHRTRLKKNILAGAV